jgi:predicted nucleic acid-binding protein
MAKNREAYVDTSALIAFADRSDSHHDLFKRLFSDPPPLVTTTLVVAEGHAWFLRRYDTTRALQFVSMIEDMRPLKLIGFGAKEFGGAVALLRQFSDQQLTIVDAAGLYLMRVRKLSVCWSTDFHLGLTGVPLAIHAGP